MVIVFGKGIMAKLWLNFLLFANVLWILYLELDYYNQKEYTLKHINYLGNTLTSIK